ncbi:type III pantothenate kinase [Pseudotenacibaculum sp. MALMAid0570]|uniref:type III pantothenate kinase n=1 Tax=Pseudotenacibaculum sp. MALMAid0570 TaxID=3143938 RepID=UPI0032DF4F42
MKNLVIDVGNTQVKAAVFESDTLLESVVFEEKDFRKNIEYLKEKYAVKHCILSSVKDIDEKITTQLNQFEYFISLNSTTKVSFTNLYSTPTTLGIDRIALVAAAISKFENKNVLIIDAGTCITYDFLDSINQYHGGAISPGINIRYKSLHDYTSKLPLLSKEENFSLIGDSTSGAIHSGIINGVIQEIEGVINQYKAKYPDLTVVLTGGDTKFLSKQLKNSIFANQNFLLYGLNQILTFNNKE